MAYKQILKTSGTTETSVKKQPYTRPVFQIYGRLHRITQGTGSVNGDQGQVMMVAGSDPNLKENIVRIGDHPLGIGLYLFDYKPEHQELYGYGRRFGVMADEVEKVMPSAVFISPNGYQSVNYEMIGISLPERSNIS